MSLTVTGTIQVRRDTAANWTTANPILAAGEWGWESNTNKLKIGDGATAWTSLAYIIAGAAITTFLGLTDTPATYVGQALEYVRVNAAETALEFQPFPVLAVVATGGEFTDLTDVPMSYTGQSLKWVRVNVGETSLEFFTPPTIPTTTAADIAGFYPGVPAASVLLTRIPLATATIFAASLTGSYGVASVAATASTVFDVRKNNVSFGTFTFAIAATTATFAGAGTTFAAGDILSVVAPATPDATLANVGFNLHGTRNI